MKTAEYHLKLFEKGPFSGRHKYLNFILPHKSVNKMSRCLNLVYVSRLALLVRAFFLNASQVR